MARQPVVQVALGQAKTVEGLVALVVRENVRVQQLDLAHDALAARQVGKVLLVDHLHDGLEQERVHVLVVLFDNLAKGLQVERAVVAQNRQAAVRLLEGQLDLGAALELGPRGGVLGPSKAVDVGLQPCDDALKRLDLAHVEAVHDGNVLVQFGNKRRLQPVVEPRRLVALRADGQSALDGNVGPERHVGQMVLGVFRMPEHCGDGRARQLARLQRRLARRRARDRRQGALPPPSRNFVLGRVVDNRRHLVVTRRVFAFTRLPPCTAVI